MCVEAHKYYLGQAILPSLGALTAPSWVSRVLFLRFNLRSQLVPVGKWTLETQLNC